MILNLNKKDLEFGFEVKMFMGMNSLLSADHSMDCEQYMRTYMVITCSRLSMSPYGC